MLPYIDGATLAQFDMGRFDSLWNLRPDIQVFSILLMAVCYGRSERPETFTIDTQLSKFLLYGGVFGDMLVPGAPEINCRYGLINPVRCPLRRHRNQRNLDSELRRPRSDAYKRNHFCGPSRLGKRHSRARLKASERAMAKTRSTHPQS